jgi:NADPH:quinone reductase-like Zn-dependent oxidoreductase
LYDVSQLERTVQINELLARSWIASFDLVTSGSLMEAAMKTISSKTRAKILVLGATGGTGRLIVAQALARGYDVTALVRSPEKAKVLLGAKLVVGDARDRGCYARP